MSVRNLPLIFMLVLSSASGPAYAEQLVMTVENIVTYDEGQLSEQQTTKARAEHLGSKVTLDFFSQDNVVRLSLPNKELLMCERVQKGFFEDQYNCSSTLDKAGLSTMTLKLETLGKYVRRGILTLVGSPDPVRAAPPAPATITDDSLRPGETGDQYAERIRDLNMKKGVGSMMMLTR